MDDLQNENIPSMIESKSGKLNAQEKLKKWWKILKKINQIEFKDFKMKSKK